MAKNLYEFVATGQGDVIKAYESIGAAAIRQKKVVEETARATAKARSGGGTTGGRGMSAEDRKFKEAERAAAKYERELQKEVRAAEKAEARKQAAEKRAAATRQRAEQQAAAAKRRGDEQAAKRAEAVAARAAKAEAAAKERAQKHVASVKDRHYREEQRKEERRERMAERAATQAARRQAQTANRQANARRRADDRERASLARESEGNRSKVIEGIADVAAGVAMGAAVSAVAAAAAAAKDIGALDNRARDISVAARKSGQGFLDKDALRRSFQATAASTPGVRSEDVADAVAKFISLTGDSATAIKGQGVFATVASGTGAGVGDVAEAAASLSQQFDITGLEDMKEVLAALTFQGKEGAFELKDAAAQFQRLAASGASFGIPKGVQGVKTLGGLTQIARTGTGSAEQAATAVENLLTNLKVKQKDLGAAGVNVFDKSGVARDVPTLITEAIAKVGGGDMGKKSAGLARIFGEQGIRAINPLIAKYSETYRGTKGTEQEKTAAAMARVREEFEKSINAPGTWADVVKDAAERQKSSTSQLTGAWEALKLAVDGPAMRAVDGMGGAMSGLTMILQAAAKDLEQIDVQKRGGKGEAEAARAEVFQMEGMMSAAGIDESMLSPENAERLRAAREIRDKYDAKASKAEQFQKDLASGKMPIASDGGGALEQFTNRYADELVAAGYEENLEDAKRRSSDIGRRMIEGGGDLGIIDRLNLPAMETPELAGARADFAARMGEGPADKVKIDTAPANEALSEFQKNVAAANAALAMMGQQGTIFAGQ